ncbi:NAD(P)-dependent dehydrogenase [Phanerochaete sordida]|uniref:NAD(P)-dependent dehydrogenase n=1 Tax=Phanerochaete sordida TaxID=48140 RepID=A0A9P3G8U1_9APHY|nr:NAD(P)-dependent dehydrogenase [Phanerochaete sordida]
MAALDEMTTAPKTGPHIEERELLRTANADFAVRRLFDVAGWSVVVTGGATGIGLMIAQAFANNGARVYITGRRPGVLATAAETWGAALAHPQGALVPLVADITDKASIQALADEVLEREGRLDVLVNNAGVSRGHSDTERGREGARALRDALWGERWEDWEATFRTNVIGHFFTSVAFLPALAAARRPGHAPCVINIASMSGITRSTQHHFNYNVSKAAVIQLTNLLAQEFSQAGVGLRVNSIAPGIFPSQMTTDGKDGQNKSVIEGGEEYGRRNGIPANRAGSERDMAQTALYIACNQYLWGQTIPVEGGWLLKNP